MFFGRENRSPRPLLLPGIPPAPFKNNFVPKKPRKRERNERNKATKEEKNEKRNERRISCRNEYGRFLFRKVRLLKHLKLKRKYLKICVIGIYILNLFVYNTR